MAKMKIGLGLLVILLSMIDLSVENIVRGENDIWPTPVIPWDMAHDVIYPAKRASKVHQALEKITLRTCLKFTVRRNERDYISFSDTDKYDCSSDLGRKGGKQMINFGACQPSDTAHEILHSLGFGHEQTRPDRDDYVEILWDNIKKGKDYQFRRKSYDDYYTIGPYDYKSIMHYPVSLYSSGGPTMRAKKPNITDIGKQDILSPTDELKLNKLYKCDQRLCSHPDLPVGGMLFAEPDMYRSTYTCKNNGNDIVTTLVGSPTRLCRSEVWSGMRPACLESVIHYCSFDDGNCGWTQLTDDKGDWELTKGKAKSSSSGPSTDNTVGALDLGYYMLLSSHNAQQKKKATMQSPSLTLPSGEAICLRYHYYMSGGRMGSLVVSTKSRGTGSKQNVAWHSGHQGEAWNEENIEIPPDTEFVLFNGRTKNADESDIAIDDVIIAPCTSLTGSQQSYPAGNTSRPGIPPIVYSCDFNTDDCSVVRRTGNWTVISKPYPENKYNMNFPQHRVHSQKRDTCMEKVPQASHFTDPNKSRAAVGISGMNCSKLCEATQGCKAATYVKTSKTCYHHSVITETDLDYEANCSDYYYKPRGCAANARYILTNQTGHFDTPVITPSKDNVHCISFYYHMDHPHTSVILSIQEIRGNKPSDFYQAGDYHVGYYPEETYRPWERVNLDIDITSPFRLRFNTTVVDSWGGGKRTMTAIDDITVYEGRCASVNPLRPVSHATVPGFDCHFDREDQCRISWNRPWDRIPNKIRNYYYVFGGDHSNTFRGYQFMADAFWKRNQLFDRVSIVVPVNDRGWCFSVAYLFVKDGTLSIMIVKEGDTTPSQALQTVSGRFKDEWRTTQVYIQSDRPFKVLLRGHTGTTDMSLVGFDDVAIIRGRCNTCEAET